MDPPHFFLDALHDSISSGAFIDTKFYAFFRREASGRVSSLQASPLFLVCRKVGTYFIPLALLFSDT